MRQSARWALLAVAFAAALAVVALMPASAAYNPGVAVRFCNALPADFPASVPSTDPDLAGNPACASPPVLPAGAPYDLTLDFNVPAGNANMSSFVTVLPSDGMVAADAAIPNGQKVAGLMVQTTIGVLGGACTIASNVDAVLYDSATTGATVSPAPEGTSDRFASLATDANSDGIADANSPLVTSNLSIYETAFDPDLDYPGGPNGPLPPVTPIARYSGGTDVFDWQLFSVFMFNASDLAAFSADPDAWTHPYARASRAPASAVLGVTILNDPTASQSSPSLLTDICPPLAIKAMLRGSTPGGQTRTQAPAAAGTRTFGIWSSSERDGDGDGIDNTLDGCPLIANLGSDSDGDGIDNACDPTPNSNTGFGDHDGDGFRNRQDNCPAIANAGAAQSNTESQRTYIVGAPDGGPRTDSIGDACDPHPATANTEGAYAEHMLMIPKCVGGIDADGDGYCATEDLNDASAGTGGFAANGGIDQDGTAEARGDGSNSQVEVYLGTDPLRACGYTPGGDPRSETWPADLAESNGVGVSDVLALKPVFGTAVPPTAQRFDIAPSKSISVTDVLALKPEFGRTCTP